MLYFKIEPVFSLGKLYLHVVHVVRVKKNWWLFFLVTGCSKCATIAWTKSKNIGLPLCACNGWINDINEIAHSNADSHLAAIYRTDDVYLFVHWV